MEIFTSIGASAVLLVLGIVVFIVLCFKGLNTAISAIIATMIVALGSGVGWKTSMFTSFTAGMASFVQSNGLAFLSIGIFAFLMRETRAGEALAKKLVSIIGVQRTPMLLAAVAVCLQLAGITSPSMIICSFAFALLKEADLPVGIGYAAVIGCPPLLSFCMPGSTALPNVIPTEYLGTTTFAAPVMSLICLAIGCTFMYFYMHFIIKRARANGEHYIEPTAQGVATKTVDCELPHFISGVVPMVTIIGIATVCQLVIHLSGTASVCVALWISSLIVILMNWDVCVHKIKLGRILGGGSMEMAPFILTVACVYGFGSVTQDSACFESLKNAIMSINLNPYLTAWLSIALFAGLCADGIGGMSLWLGMFGESFAAMPGVNAAALHRILVTSATTFDSLPHSPQIANSLAIFRTTHKESYKHAFWLTVVNPVIFSLAAVVIAILFY